MLAVHLYTLLQIDTSDLGTSTAKAARMCSASDLCIAHLAKSRAEGDFTLKCQGEVIKAHSFILRTR